MTCFIIYKLLDGQGLVRTRQIQEELYFALEDNKHQEGVAIILSKQASRSLIEYDPTNGQVLRARRNNKPIKTTIIQVYSPRNELKMKPKLSSMK